MKINHRRGRPEKPENKYRRLAWACELASRLVTNPLLAKDLLEASIEFKSLRFLLPSPSGDVHAGARKTVDKPTR